MNYNIIPKIKKIIKWHSSSPVGISLFVLIPFIFTGFAVLAFIIAYYADKASTLQIMLLGGTVIAFTAFSAIVITFAILNPVRKFIDAAESSPAFPKASTESSIESQKHDEIKHFDYIFRQATNLIGKLDASERFPGIVGQSRAIREVLSQVIKVAPTDSTVLILGESGVGKELIATAIYEESRRQGKPFIKINCVAIPAGLLESELFGYEKGAFTGAVARKIGKFEQAHNGTLFLDEIGDMALETQAKLLRVLQERQFERVGGNATIDVNVRFIAASNKDLRRMVEEGTFREDLFYRLNVFPIYVPPLRERVEDIPLLVQHILACTPDLHEMAPEAMRELMTWYWPGNVRELRNVLERAVVMADTGRITSIGLMTQKEIPGKQQRNFPQNALPEPEEEVAEIPRSKDVYFLGEGFSLDDHLAVYERDIILHALKKTGGIQTQAALLLGINQRSLWHRIKKHKIDVANMKSRE